MEIVRQITEEQLEKVRSLHKNLNDTLVRIGLLDSQKHAALHSLAGINKDMEEYKLLLEEQYGSIDINLEDGTYKTIENGQTN